MHSANAPGGSSSAPFVDVTVTIVTSCAGEAAAVVAIADQIVAAVGAALRENGPA